MNSKNKNTEKGLRLECSQRNNTAYPTDVKLAARYLSTQYPNNKPTNQRGGNKETKRIGNDPKSGGKDSNAGGTAGAHIEDTTTNEDITTPSGGTSLGAYISETNQASSRQPCTVDEMLGAHTVNNNFQDSTNPTDVSINTVNSEEKMTGSHITKFHTHQDEQPVKADLLSQEDQDYNN